MNDAGTPTTRSWKHPLRQLSAELGRMVTLRRKLAELELNHDRQLLRRCLVHGGVGTGMAVVGISLLLHAAAECLDKWHVTALTATAWTAILGSVLLLPSMLLVALAIRRFRSDFRGLRDTLAELQEDLIWVREWAQSSGSQAGNDDSDARGNPAIHVKPHGADTLSGPPVVKDGATTARPESLPHGCMNRPDRRVIGDGCRSA